MVYYYRRALGGRDGAELSAVYAVIPTEGEKPDPVAVLAGYLANWRPTEHPGQCLFEIGAESEVFLTHVPRSQFRHYTLISDADALALYPNLLR